jgi:hypothetical protein
MNRALVSVLAIAAMAACSGQSQTSATLDGGASHGSDSGRGDAGHARADAGHPAKDSGPHTEADTGVDARSQADARGNVDGMTTEAGGDAHLRADAHADSGTDAGHDAGSSCPGSSPAHGSACTSPGLECSYGSDPRASCRVSATCTSGEWVVVTPACSAPPTCPAMKPGAGVTCTTVGAVCGYGADSCECYSCDIPCGSPDTWHCAATSSGCPGSLPNLGTACSPDGSLCDYGACTGSWEVSCTGGVWVRQFTVCPG